MGRGCRDANLTPTSTSIPKPQHGAGLKTSAVEAAPGRFSPFFLLAAEPSPASLAAFQSHAPAIINTAEPAKPWCWLVLATGRRAWLCSPQA